MTELIKNNYSLKEEVLNSITHGIGVVIAIFGLVYMILRAEGATAITSVSIYGASLIIMFLASTVYHAIPNEKIKPLLKLIDHSSIYILIAGTYTPFLLISIQGWTGIVGVALIWTIALAGLIFKWLVGHKHPKISLAFYLVMGWLSVLLIYPLYNVISGGGLWLLLGGGLFFSVGVGFYMAKHLPFTHAIWHCFVVAGCVCHFMSIYYYVI
ncbi:MAG: hemolysin III family protein [Gammaproteobacteria bacterium]|nr:hemolysin III family protein [Gammaproteobacteria bacterium]MDH5630812.1 hemolysin III family protein [Gammaproteobacteria bacterium]